jgi:ubiquinone/menaquinone biosynthesis C-methylase UbiE
VTAIDLAEHMLVVGRKNVAHAGLGDRLTLECVDGKQMPYADAAFRGVISNSIIHHIPRPEAVFAEMVRVVAKGGVLFVRDLLRPDDEAALRHLVETYAGDANAHQQQMFGDSLHAALSLDEVRAMVSSLGFAPQSVTQTTDRHWTWTAHK